MCGSSSESRDLRRHFEVSKSTVKAERPTESLAAPRARLGIRLEVIFALALLVVLVTARVVAFLHAGALWRDEVDSVNLASDPAYVETWMHDWFPALFLAVLRGWIVGFGDSDMCLRSFGLLCGLLHVAAIWWSGRQFGACVPWALLVLLAFHPTLIVYGDEVRPYGLGVLTQLIMVAHVWRFVQSPTWSRWALLQVAALLAVQTTYNNSVMLLAACAGAALVCLRRREVKPIFALIAAGLVAAVSVLPFFLNAISPANEWAVVLRQDLPWSWHVGVFFQAVGLGGPTLCLVWPAAVIMSLGVAFTVLRPARPALTQPATVDKALFLLGNMVVGTAGFWTYIRLTRLPTQVWYYLPFMTLLILCVELGGRIAADIKPWFRWVPVAASALVFVGMLFYTWPALEMRFTNVDLLVEPLAEQATAGDLVVVCPWYVGLSFDRYYRGEAPSMNFPDVERERKAHGGYQEIKQKMAQDDPIRAELKRIEETLRAGGRIWLVGRLDFLPQGARPLRLPPAPHPDLGWSEAAYETSWSQQAAFLLQTRGATIRQIPVPVTVRVNPYENLPLFLIEGWREPSPP